MGEWGSRRQERPRRSGQAAIGSRRRIPRVKPQGTGTVRFEWVHLNGDAGQGEGGRTKMRSGGLAKDGQTTQEIPQRTIPLAKATSRPKTGRGTRRHTRRTEQNRNARTGARYGYPPMDRYRLGSLARKYTSSVRQEI